ncbi:MAG: hypothetical protein ACOYEK_09210 [bacterium]|jgi:hypothetical protein
MVDLLLLPFHLAAALLTFAGRIILFPVRLVFNLALGFVIFLGSLFLAVGILLALFLGGLASGVILCLLGLGLLLISCRR